MNGKQNTGEQLREMARLFGGSMPSRQTLLGALRRMGRYDSPSTDTELEQLLAAGISADKERIAQLEARNAELVEALQRIVELSRHLRQSGPDPMDLIDLSDALELATDEAHTAIAKQEATQ